jgi:hypothetical protein
MKEQFIIFLQNPKKDTFLALRSVVISHNEYSPYSDDLKNINNLLLQNKFIEVAQYSNINILLSSRAHMYKSFAYKKLKDERGAETESKIGQTILEGIEYTGKGTLEKPFLVTRIDDERDFITYLDEIFESQALVNYKEKTYDCITTSKGKKIYFDISDCYKKMSDQFNMGQLNIETIYNDIPAEIIKKDKKWWKFW